MRYLSTSLLLGGLVIMTGPLCVVQAQDFVDLEAERAAEAARAAPVDPYGVRPAQAYPATSFGASGTNAPAATAVTPAAANSRGSGQNLGNLLFKVQQLQQEVMRLNGKVEEQAHELRQLKDQSLQRYMELDKRFKEAGASTATAAGAVTAGNTQPALAAPARGNQSGVAEQLGEGEAYRAAYALVRGQQFDQAVKAFQQFQRNFPGGKYAPNTYYWLGELYLVVEPPDLESSRQAFSMLLSQYPNDNKAPDALYKLGKVQFMKGNREKARQYLDQVISQYGSTNSAAVKLARDFIAANY